jgi:hypothetical protein
MNTAYRAAALLIISLSVFASCKQEITVDVLSPEEIASVLAESMLNTVSSDKPAEIDSVHTLQAILNKRDISMPKFDRSISHYRGQNSVWLKILEEAATILDAEKTKQAKADSIQDKK